MQVSFRQVCDSAFTARRYAPSLTQSLIHSLSRSRRGPSRRCTIMQETSIDSGVRRVCCWAPCRGRRYRSTAAGDQQERRRSTALSSKLRSAANASSDALTAGAGSWTQACSDSPAVFTWTTTVNVTVLHVNFWFCRFNSLYNIYLTHSQCYIITLGLG